MARTLLAALLALLFGCPAGQPEGRPYPAPSTASDGRTVARVGPVVFTTAEMEQRMAKQSPFVRVQLKAPEKKQLFVKEQIRNELLAQEAWSQKLYDDPEVKAEFRKVLVKRLMKKHLESIEAEMKITETDLVRAYEERRDEFHKPPKVRLSQIVRYVDGDAARKKERALLDKLMSQVLAAQKKNDHRYFEKVVREHSQDADTNKGGGDLQMLTREQLTERFGEKVAGHMFDAVEVGGLAVADAENAVILFKKTGARRGVDRSLEQVKPRVRGALLGEKRAQAFDKMLDDLMKKHAVDIDTQAVAEIQVPE